VLCASEGRLAARIALEFEFQRRKHEPVEVNSSLVATRTKGDVINHSILKKEVRPLIATQAAAPPHLWRARPRSIRRALPAYGDKLPRQSSNSPTPKTFLPHWAIHIGALHGKNSSMRRGLEAFGTCSNDLQGARKARLAVTQRALVGFIEFVDKT
jgi:hypothetical protein